MGELLKVFMKHKSLGFRGCLLPVSYTHLFTGTLVKPYRRWEFDMENSNMTGHWTGIFTAKGAETEIDFTEQVKAKKWPVSYTHLDVYKRQNEISALLSINPHTVLKGMNVLVDGGIIYKKRGLGKMCIRDSCFCDVYNGFRSRRSAYRCE